ncbi:Uncharacterised protein [Serratia grimesii]|nr:Uncharacterised protein [Serratia grimesii]
MNNAFTNAQVIARAAIRMRSPALWAMAMVQLKQAWRSK